MSRDGFGLSLTDKSCIAEILIPFAHHIENISVFGSRASGRARIGSDLDLLIKGAIDFRTMLRLAVAFEESRLPYRVDLLHERELIEPDVRNAILRTAKPLFSVVELRKMTER